MGQMAFTLAVSSRDPSRLAIGIDTAGVYVSADGGRTWQLRREGILANGVQSVAFDPQNADVLWAAGLRSVPGTPEGLIPRADRDLYSDPDVDGIYRSEDFARHFALVRRARFFRRQAQNEYFAFDPASFDGAGSRTVFAATHSEGLLVTSDGGRSFRALGFDFSLGQAEDVRLNAVIAHPSDPKQLLVAADTGFFRSDDAGESFRKLGAGLPAPVLGLAADPGDPSVVYAACGEGGLWRSQDGGVSFTRRMEGVRPADAGMRWARVAASPADPRNLLADATRAGGPMPYRSRDGAATWSPVGMRADGFFGSGVFWAEGLAFHPTDPGVAFHAHPVRKTLDGGETWLLSSDGISGSRRTTRTSIAFRADDPAKMVFFFVDHGSARTADAGDTFEYVPPPRQGSSGARTTAVGAGDPRPGSRRLVSAVGDWKTQEICTSDDDGDRWAVQPKTDGRYLFMAVHPQKPDVVYAGRATDSLVSLDGGQTWRAPLPYSIRAVYPRDGDIVYATTGAGASVRVLRSSDAAETWKPLPDLPERGEVKELDVDAADPDRLYVAALGAVLVFDGGSWSVRDQRHGLQADAFGMLSFSAIAADPIHSGVVYAGQAHAWRGLARGVFRSTDGGQNWQNISRNLGPDLNVWAITVSPHDGTVWLGTDYGNWRLPAP